MSKNRSDVMVVGAGPTGLAAACELARRGVAVRVIDKLPAPTTESRAILVHARSLEMFDQMGVADEIIGSGVKTLGMQMLAAGRKGHRDDHPHDPGRHAAPRARGQAQE